MKTLIKNATIVNEGTEQVASLLIDGETIAAILTAQQADTVTADEVIDATGKYLMPGVIDDHVHMRDPGLTHKADMESETRAAAAGGVTSVMDMPNVVPQTTTLALWEEKMAHAAQTCRVNYACYLGATNTNIDEVRRMDTHRIPALKLFMGSSTGGMLVDKEEQLSQIFSECPTLIMTHCEDTDRINERMAQAKEAQRNKVASGDSSLPEDDLPSIMHPWIRDDEACYRSSALAVRLAQKTGARLHLAHITTAKELALINDNPSTSSGQAHNDNPSTNSGQAHNENERFGQITAEVCPQHLYFTQEFHDRLGTLIKCNPAIKTKEDRDALRRATADGRITVIGTDHAPHLLNEKRGGAVHAVSGMPMMQFSLPLMLTFTDDPSFVTNMAVDGQDASFVKDKAEDGQEALTLTRPHLVELMCHNPALLFGIEKRGFIRPGYKADLTLVERQSWTITEKDILSKCGWSPLTGTTLQWRVCSTWCNGHKVYDGKAVDDNYRGQALLFSSK